MKARAYKIVDFPRNNEDILEESFKYYIDNYKFIHEIIQHTKEVRFKNFKILNILNNENNDIPKNYSIKKYSKKYNHIFLILFSGNLSRISIYR